LFGDAIYPIKEHAGCSGSRSHTMTGTDNVTNVEYPL
jgi:hypothetical protein